MKLELIEEETEIVFNKLCNKVKKCNLCPRMANSQRVLNYSSGSLTSKIMFIGEAPGRLGADESGIPFHGDKSGHNFEELLHFAKIHREEIFVTNAVLCNPKDSKGNNSTPNNLEIANCSTHLQQQIEIVKPKIVITLGATALEATRLLKHHTLTLKGNVRTANRWYNTILIPLYHPGQRAMVHRSFANQRSDYQFVADQFKRLQTTRPPRKSSPLSIDIALIVEYILSKQNTMSYFSLHKLFYLIEYKAFKVFGYRLSDAYIIRQKDGPYCTDLHIDKLKKTIPDFNSYFKGNRLFIHKNSSGLFNETLLNEYELDDKVSKLIDEVLTENGRKNNSDLKRTVYFSRPMRNILRIEKEMKVNMYNTAIIFTDQDVL